MIKAVLAYTYNPALTQEEYEKWLDEVHVPDLLSNPYLEKIVFNTTREVVKRASDGTIVTKPENPVPFRVAELHFQNEQTYQLYKDWFKENPPPSERGPSGRTDFIFYVITDVREITR